MGGGNIRMKRIYFRIKKSSHTTMSKLQYMRRYLNMWFVLWCSHHRNSYLCAKSGSHSYPPLAWVFTNPTPAKRWNRDIAMMWSKEADDLFLVHQYFVSEYVKIFTRILFAFKSMSLILRPFSLEYTFDYCMYLTDTQHNSWGLVS